MLGKRPYRYSGPLGSQNASFVGAKIVRLKGKKQVRHCLKRLGQWLTAPQPTEEDSHSMFVEIVSDEPDSYLKITAGERTYKLEFWSGSRIPINVKLYDDRAIFTWYDHVMETESAQLTLKFV